MEIVEIASAEEQMALWKLINDNVWAAIHQQARDEAERKAAAQRAATPQQTLAQPTQPTARQQPLPSAQPTAPTVSAQPQALPPKPLKPNQNAYIESFNGRFRDECLNEHWFTSMAHARVIVEAWRREYNEERPRNPWAD